MASGRLLIAGWAGMGNLGDDWLVTGLRDFLAPRSSVGLLVEPDASMPASTDVIRWPRLGKSLRPAELRAFRREVNTYSAVVFAGGGWLAGDQGPRSPARWAARLRLLRRPIFGLGLGIGPFVGSGGRWFGGACLRRFDDFFVRANADRTWACELGIDPGPAVGDLALLTGVGQVRDDASRSGAVISLPAPRQHWWPADAGDYARLLRDFVGDIVGDEEVTFIPFQRGEAGDQAFWVDHGFRISELSLGDALDRISSARLVVAGRLHAAIAATIRGTPLVAVGYHHKFEILRRYGVIPVSASDLTHRPAPCQPDLNAIAVDSDRVRARSLQMLADVL